MRTMIKALSIAALAAAASPISSAAHAQTGDALRPGTRPMFATFGVGPAAGLSGSVTQLKIAEAFGYHLSGDSSGLAIGVELQQSFGSSIFALEMGPKAWFDIQPIANLGFYLSPSVMLGFGYASASFGGSAAGFDMQFGFEGKLIINDRGLVFFRPFTLDITVGDGTAVRWDVMFGGGVTF